MDVRALIFVLGSSGSQLLTKTIIAASSVADTPILAVKFLITHQLRETGQYHRAGVRRSFKSRQQYSATEVYALANERRFFQLKIVRKRVNFFRLDR